MFGVVRGDVGERLILTGSYRYDDPDDFRSRGTGRIAAALRLGGGFTATASAGQGFKTPTISEVVCDYCFAAPVPLKPEKATAWATPGVLRMISEARWTTASVRCSDAPSGSCTTTMA